VLLRYLCHFGISAFLSISGDRTGALVSRLGTDVWVLKGTIVEDGSNEIYWIEIHVFQRPDGQKTCPRWTCQLWGSFIHEIESSANSLNRV